MVTEDFLNGLKEDGQAKKDEREAKIINALNTNETKETLKIHEDEIKLEEELTAIEQTETKFANEVQEIHKEEQTLKEITEPTVKKARNKKIINAN